MTIAEQVSQFVFEDADEIIRTVVPFINTTLLLISVTLLAASTHRIRYIERIAARRERAMDAASRPTPPTSSHYINE